MNINKSSSQSQTLLKHIHSNTLTSLTNSPILSISLPAKWQVTFKTPNERKRLNAILEIYNSEITFLNSMDEFIQNYYIPIRNSMNSWSPILDKASFDTFFSVLISILPTNRELLRQVSRLVKSPEPKVGSFFLSVWQFLRIYKVYARHYHVACSLFQEKIRFKSSRFSQFIKEQDELSGNRNQTFSSYLFLPLQRITRYHLMLQNLKTHTPNSHEDFDELSEALARIQEGIVVTEAVNLAIGEHKANIDILSIHKQLLGYPKQLIIPGRYFIKQDSMKEITKSGKKKRILFLFNDILICASKNRLGETYFRLEIPLYQCNVTDIKDDNKWKHCFKLESPAKSCIVSAETLDSKMEWFVAINEQIANLRISQKKHGIASQKRNSNELVKLINRLYPNAAVQLPDENVLQCQLCSNKFNFLRRKHHCRFCGFIVCISCSSQSVNIPGRRNWRICTKCSKNIISVAKKCRIPYSLFQQFEIQLRKSIPNLSLSLSDSLRGLRISNSQKTQISGKESQASKKSHLHYTLKFA